MYYVSKRMEIAGAHNLKLNYESKCSNIHGHNWIVTVYLKSEELDQNGMVMDFTQIKKRIHNKLDHQYINKVNEYLASTIESSIKRAFPLYKNRGIKEGNLYVLNQTFMPSVLIELGFITNSDDRSNLINPEWQKKMADAIASAIRSL